MDLTKLLSEEELSKYSQAIENKEHYEYDNDGLSIYLDFNDNCEEIHICYSKPNTEKEDFVEFVNNLDDDLFIEVCEKLDVQRLNDALNSDNIETVRSAINKFKLALKEFAQSKVEYYSKLAK